MRNPLILVLTLIGCSGDDTGEDTAIGDPVEVSLDGALAKGPFVLGSTVDVSTLDGSYNPTGDLFSTVTIDDSGAFALEFSHLGPAEIAGNGFYYNEVTGELSGAAITLRAYYEVTQPGAQSVYVNLVTHLTHDRVANLVEGGATLDAAVTQAETELQAASGIGGANFDPGVPGIAMDVIGGDNDANAYLFGVSSVVAQAAVTRAGDTGSVDANLQELVNVFAVDLAPDGQLTAGNRTMLDEAQAALDIDTVETAFAARLDQIGNPATVPDLDRVIDTDLDGIVNAGDNCPFYPNAGQEDADSDGVGDACICGNNIVNVGEECDDDNTTSGDGCQADCLYPRCDDGVYDVEVFVGQDPLPYTESCPPVVCTLIEPNAQDNPECFEPDPPKDGCESWEDCQVTTTATHTLTGTIRWLDSGDFNGDGDADMVAVTADGKVHILNGAGDGTFASPVELATVTGAHWGMIGPFYGSGGDDLLIFSLSGPTARFLGGGGGLTANGTLTGHDDAWRGLLADVSGDANPDLVTAGTADTEVVVRVSEGDGTGFGAAVTQTMGMGSPYVLESAELTGDANADLLLGVTNGGPGLYVLAGDGSAAWTTHTTFARNSTSVVLLEDVVGGTTPDLIVIGGGNWDYIEVQGGGSFGTPVQFGFSSTNGPPGSVDGPPLMAQMVTSQGQPAVLHLTEGFSMTTLDGSGWGQSYGANNGFFYADLNADTAPDLVAVDRDNTSQIGVWVSVP
ncbi:MAG: VCBS repeat-containing protein [Proteobacteria bacterium]|nr:VCBS repeat-containing protein [Pseudomonadota bacterium]